MKDFIEMKEKRKAREKHFLMSDGTILAQVFSDDVHYLKDGIYEEIDNHVIENENGFEITKNDFQVFFKEKGMEIKNKNYFISMYLQNGLSVKPQKLAEQNGIIYCDILENIDLKYHVLPTKVKEVILLKQKREMSEIAFLLKTNLELSLASNSIVKALENGKKIFELETPYMVDSTGIVNRNLTYQLKKQQDFYLLTLKLDEDWLSKAKYPVMIDPTITNSGQNQTVYDTYIYPGDSNVNRNNHDYLKIGVERANNKDTINRALIKFELPTIETGSQIVNAKMYLIGYPSTKAFINPILNQNKTIYDVHRLTQDWKEDNATWNTMNNKYDIEVEDAGYMEYSPLDGNDEISAKANPFDITNLVKRWYSGTPNYGVLIKAHNEVFVDSKNYLLGKCFSKDNHTQGDNPKPILAITYRNQTGLEDYMAYHTHSFTDGAGYVNYYNGNLTTSFQVAKTYGNKFPVTLNYIYNLNDALKYEYEGVKRGWKFNLSQTIKEVTIENNLLLEYTDADGTIHYFYKGDMVNQTSDVERKDHLFYDEDGLSLTIEKQNDDYVMNAKDGTTYYFMKYQQYWYLSKITNANNDKIEIKFEDPSAHRITDIIDGNGESIHIDYFYDYIEIKNSDGVFDMTHENGVVQGLSTKLSGYSFTYDENGLISSIQEHSGKKICYEYHQTNPYRVKKVSEYSIDGELGKFYTFEYGNETTIVKDNKNRITVLSFNSNGSVVNVSNMDKKDHLKDAYGTQSKYGEKLFTEGYNRLTEELPLVKPIKNYILNSSFEENKNIPFLSGNTVVSNTAFSGEKSLKIVSTTTKEVSHTITIPKGEFYTFSVYVKNNCPVKLGLSYKDKENKNVIVYSDKISESEEFYREQVTILYPSDATSNLTLKILLENAGTIYLDDLQLEEGKVANAYNILDQFDFENGLGKWKETTTVAVGDEMEPYVTLPQKEILTLLDGTKALKLKGDPYVNDLIELTIPLKGRASDTYDLYFWMKNKGVPTILRPMNSRACWITFNYTGTPPVGDIEPIEMLVSHNDEWYLHHETVYAEADYSSLTIHIINQAASNDLYLANFSLFKRGGHSTFKYDENGNLIHTYNPTSKELKFEYDKNNQLIVMTNQKGTNFSYEYDKNTSNKLLNAISPTGIVNSICYNEFNNPTVTKIQNIGDGLQETNYYIREKGTNDYVTVNALQRTLNLEQNTCSHDSFKIEKSGDYYRIKSNTLINCYLFNSNNNVILSDQFTLFDLIKLDNGSYRIKTKEAAFYLSSKNSRLMFTNQIEDNTEFYLEKCDLSLFIENTATYTADGKFVTSTTDTLEHTTIYDVNEVNGSINSVTDAKGDITSYTYDDCDRITSVEKGDKKAKYKYNNSNLISEINSGTKKYSFVYDNFLNIKGIKINNQNLITNNYAENNGQLLSSVYGNNQTISHEYDNFDRPIKTIKMDDSYEIKYDNLGNVARIDTSNDHHYKYYHDIDNRLIQYRYDDFRIRYHYMDKNIDNKYYDFEDIEKNIHYDYNQEEAITKITFDNQSLNYVYDELGRLVSQNINDKYHINYSYVTNGKKTSFLLKEQQNENNRYRYLYDKLNNITHIYYNDILTNVYEYDSDNQLVKEYDYIQNTMISYSYDNNGNLKKKETYQKQNDIYQLKSTDTYTYGNSWEDQLTKFNTDIISYDNIGNPTKIGNINLTWMNGRQLQKYVQGNKTITYQYNKDGIRTKKIQNGVETIYHVENGHIIFEKTGNNVLYYIRDGIGELIGFEYQNSIYYYEKNAQNDIIGILNDKYQRIATYTYDSWGNILSIKDANNKDVTANHIANINPFRYRSYYYDSETNLYYLNSRYYNPVWGRFLNADGIIGANGDIISYNLYAYCSNNPINMYDQNGYIWSWIQKQWNGVKQTIKRVMDNIVKKIKVDYILEVGSGSGTGVSAKVIDSGLEVTNYIDYNEVKKNNNKYSSVTEVKGFTIGSFGFSETNEKIISINGEVISDPKLEKEYSFSIGSFDLINKKIFIGFDADIHISAGGHIKWGFEISW